MNKIIPNWFKKWDQHLRENYPWIWASKVHEQLLMTGVMVVLGCLLGLGIHVSLTRVPDTEEIFSLLCVPMVLWFAFICWRMFLFNPDKHFGIATRVQRIWMPWLWLLNIVLCWTLPYSTSSVLNYRIANLLTEEEMYQDAEVLARTSLFIPGRLSSYRMSYWPNDSIYQAYLEGKDKKDFKHQVFINEVEKLYACDLEEMKDSIYDEEGVFLSSRPKLYIQLYGNRGILDTTFNHDKEVIHFNIHQDMGFLRGQLEELKGLMTKYEHVPEGSIEKIVELFSRHEYDVYSERKKVDWKEGVNEMEDVQRRIYQEKRFKRLFHFDFKFLAFFLPISVLILLSFLIAFKNVHWRAFILMIVVGLLYQILAGVLMVLTSYDELHFWMSVLVVPFGIICALKMKHEKSYRPFLTQGVLLMSLLLPFIFMLIHIYLDDTCDIYEAKYFDKYKVHYTTEQGKPAWRYSEAYYVLKNRIFWSVYLGNIALYLLVFQYWVQKVLRKNWALPKSS